MPDKEGVKQLVPIPPTQETVNTLFGADVHSEAEMQAWYDKERVAPPSGEATNGAADPNPNPNPNPDPNSNPNPDPDPDPNPNPNPNPNQARLQLALLKTALLLGVEVQVSCRCSAAG